MAGIIKEGGKVGKKEGKKVGNRICGFSGRRPRKTAPRKSPGGGGGGFRRQTKGDACHKNIRLTFVKMVLSPDSGNLFDSGENLDDLWKSLNLSVS